MKERPILFSAPMVRAVLDGSKTQTRRLIKPQPVGIEEYTSGFVDEAWASGHIDVKCPYGKVGDRLWVRETWRPFSWQPNPLTVEYRADGIVRNISLPDHVDEEGLFDSYLKLDAECKKAGCACDEEGNYSWDDSGSNPIRWRPSIFMPRWASRITLEITDVRVERLQDISEEDARAEGADPISEEVSSNPLIRYRAAFHSLWSSINGIGSWQSNPWVWVISFKVVKA